MHTDAVPLPERGRTANTTFLIWYLYLSGSDSNLRPTPLVQLAELREFTQMLA